MQPDQNEIGNVISMTNFKQDNDMQAPADVRAYWETLRRGQLVPYRSEVDPRAIENTLPYAFIGEKVAPGHVRLRIAGTHLTDLMGMEVRGMPLSALFDPTARKELSERLEQVLDSPAAVTMTLTGDSGFRRPELTARLVLLPMRNDLGDISRVLGCLESSGRTGRTPRRFVISEVRQEKLRSAPTIPAKDTEVEAPHRPLTGFREPRPVFKSAAPNPAAPWLRVVRDEDE